MDIFPVIMTIVVVGVNAIWYWMKYILQQNGYKVSWFWGHFSDFPNMRNLIKKTEDPTLKRKYRLVLLSIPTGIVMSILVFIVVVPTQFSMLDEKMDEYANTFPYYKTEITIEGKVEEVILDGPRSGGGCELMVNSEGYTLGWAENGLYQPKDIEYFIQVDDSIYKSNTDEILIFRDGKEYQFIISKRLNINNAK